jgi:hypothetical protein
MEINEKDKEKLKRIPDLDENENLVKTLIGLPEETFKRLGQEALDRGVAKATIVREAIRKHFEKTENPTELNPEAVISDKDLNEILEHCTTYYGGFEIDGEDGFIALMEANEFKLSDLTPEQWKRVKDKIAIGYNGYTFKPSLEEFAEKFEVLEPSEEQKRWLSTETEEESTETEEEPEEAKE